MGSAAYAETVARWQTAGLPDNAAFRTTPAPVSSDLFVPCVIRQTAPSTLTFGIGGKVTISPAPEFRYGGIDVYADGRILVAGACRHLNATSGCNATFGAGKFLLMRLTAAGALDISFAAGGINYFALGATAITHIPPTSPCCRTASKVLFTASCAVGAAGDPNPNGAVFCFARFEGEPSPPVLCTLDLDGDGQVLATTDALLHLRIALGVPTPQKRQASPFRPAQHATTGALSTPTCVRYARQHHRIARWILTATASIPR